MLAVLLSSASIAVLRLYLYWVESSEKSDGDKKIYKYMGWMIFFGAIGIFWYEMADVVSSPLLLISVAMIVFGCVWAVMFVGVWIYRFFASISKVIWRFCKYGMVIRVKNRITKGEIKTVENITFEVEMWLLKKIRRWHVFDKLTRFLFLRVLIYLVRIYADCNKVPIRVTGYEMCPPSIDIFYEFESKKKRSIRKLQQSLDLLQEDTDIRVIVKKGVLIML